MEKNACIKFEEILYTLQEKGITSKAELMNDANLWGDFWIAVRDFAEFAIHSKLKKTAVNGKELASNQSKLAELTNNNIITEKDLSAECAIQIITYADKMLSKATVAYMKNYAFDCVSTILDRYLRKYPVSLVQFVSIDEPLHKTRSEDENPLTYLDVIPDTFSDPCSILIAHESVKEIQRTVIHEAAVLKKHPGEIFAYYAIHRLKLKPRDLAKMVIDSGCEKSFSSVIFEVGKEHYINRSKLMDVLKGIELRPESVWLSTGDRKKIASQISHLADRADGKLKRNEKYRKAH